MTEVIALCGFALLAGFVDAIAGGGGLIQVPALFAIFPNAAPAMLLGTNKFSALTGTTIATLRYGWSVSIRWRVAIPAAAIAGSAALAGAETVTLIDISILRPLLLVLLSIMVLYTFARPKLGKAAEPAGHPASPRTAGFLALAGVFGFYDGFFGPGAGSVLMFALVRWFGLDFLRAAATTKVLNLTTNLCALLLFAWTGNVLYGVAVPMAACNVCGGFLGAHLAVRRGSGFVRTVFLTVTVALTLKVLVDVLNAAYGK
jgi:uncharacterized membrane protein YfcA